MRRDDERCVAIVRRKCGGNVAPHEQRRRERTALRRREAVGEEIEHDPRQFEGPNAFVSPTELSIGAGIK